MKVSLSIVIPALNEVKTITHVIEDAQKNSLKYCGKTVEILVADNGSTDGTIEKVRNQKIAKLIHVPIRGYGAALHWGILKSSGDYVLFADADCSYPFSNLKNFIPIIQTGADLVLGSRLKGTIEPSAMPFLNRYLGTPVLTWLIHSIYKIPTTDCNSGMRIVRKSFYQNLNMRNSGMEWASELLIKSALHRGMYREVPIKFKKDSRGKKPHLSPWSDGWRHLKAIILLKPSVLSLLLYSFMLLFGLLLNVSFSLSYLFYSLSLLLSLSLMTLKLLEFTIEEKPNYFSRLLTTFPLVPLTIIGSIVSLVFLLLIPEQHTGSKMFIVGTLSIIYIWLFQVETIKTHLVNPLPKSV